MKMSFKLLIIISVINLSSYCFANKFIKLKGTIDNPFDVDGRPRPGVDASSIKDILQIMKSLKNIHAWNEDKQSFETGEFSYEGKKCGIKELYLEEERLNKFPNSKKEKSLKNAFHLAKNKFEDIFGNYLAALSIPIVKKKFSGYILESLDVPERKIKNSILRDWAYSDIGNEKVIFNEKILTFKDLDNFITHVKYFLGDLLTSCPIACKDYCNQMKKNG